jgi:hypothetical protein
VGYHLTILRTDGSKLIPISDSDFAGACAGEPSLIVGGDGASAQLMQNHELIATLRLEDGQVWTKNSEDEVLAVMLRLATLLNARVRGSEGETYRTINESYRHQDDELIEGAAVPRADEVIRKRRFWNVVRLVVLLLVIALIVINKLRQ